MDDITMLSEDKEVYQWVCITFMKCVVGSNQWAWQANKELLSVFTTESDESFVLLTLENNYEHWKTEFEYVKSNDDDEDDDDYDDDEAKKNLPEAKYTNSGNSRKNGQGSSRRFHGWSREGYLRFNEIHAKVKGDRRSRATFELELKEMITREFTESGKVAVDTEDDEDEIVPANDMVGVRQPE